MPVINLKETGLNIKNKMKSNNVKVVDVQRELGFSTAQAIYKWFRGDSLPTVDNLLILATLLNTTIDDLLIY